MRMFAATLPNDATPRTVVPVDILRRLAFGRPQRGAIQPALPVQPAAPAEAVAAPLPRDDSVDLDQRVRQSGEW
ncbi:hypothetical protein ACFPOE_06800 [Caenimonas terrae]|uniref:Uncharacterized protein n=1 Tax=Caenimonas terrae TaxID=696074 RepID=A0ABW0N983_9BURK